MNDQHLKHIEYELLCCINTYDKPIGAGALFSMLCDGQANELSEATIGRYLRRMEQQGLLESKAYDGRSRGRVITEKGKARIRDLSLEKKQLQSIEDAMRLFNNGVDKQLKYILAVREIIEPKIAAFAAQNATAENLDAMRRILEDMDKLTAEKKSMATTDAPFHIEIAKASGNPILETIIQILRTDQDYSPEIEYIIRPTLRKTYSDHWEIFKAIESRDTAKAQRIMQRHIHKLRAKVESYEKNISNSL